jgi:hypothetical protein
VVDREVCIELSEGGGHDALPLNLDHGIVSLLDGSENAEAKRI